MLQNAAFVVAVCTFPNSLRFMDSTLPTMHTQFVSMNFVQFKKIEIHLQDMLQFVPGTRLFAISDIIDVGTINGGPTVK